MYSRLRRDLIVPLRFVSPARHSKHRDAHNVSFWPKRTSEKYALEVGY